MTFDELKAEVLRRSYDERAVIANMLLGTLDHDAEYSDQEFAEDTRRLETMRARPETVISFEEMQRILDKA
jgi:hypothetical protein